MRLSGRRAKSGIEKCLEITVNKQLLDEVFVIFRIIEVKVGVISRNRRPRLITLTETSIILDIRKPNLIVVLLNIERKNACMH